MTDLDWMGIRYEAQVNQFREVVVHKTIHDVELRFISNARRLNDSWVKLNLPPIIQAHIVLSPNVDKRGLMVVNCDNKLKMYTENSPTGYVISNIIIKRIFPIPNSNRIIAIGCNRIYTVDYIGMLYMLVPINDSHAHGIKHITTISPHNTIVASSQKRILFIELKNNSSVVISKYIDEIVLGVSDRFVLTRESHHNSCIYRICIRDNMLTLCKISSSPIPFRSIQFLRSSYDKRDRLVLIDKENLLVVYEIDEHLDRLSNPITINGTFSQFVNFSSRNFIELSNGSLLSSNLRDVISLPHKLLES